MIVRKYISEFFVAVSILAGNCLSVLLLDFRTCLISNGLLRFFTQTCYHSCDSMGFAIVKLCIHRYSVGTLLYISWYSVVHIYSFCYLSS